MIANDASVVGNGLGASCAINPKANPSGGGATTWDEDGPRDGSRSIRNGTPPYTATYQGQSLPNLNALVGFPASIYNTGYTLTISVPGATGATHSLRCWTLEIYTQ